jgi:hypothetical protein
MAILEMIQTIVDIFIGYDWLLSIHILLVVGISLLFVFANFQIVLRVFIFLL